MGGQFTWTEPKGPGTFVYTADFLGRQDALPLDPIRLPLSSRVSRTQHQSGVFGVFRDAGPDSWGEEQLKRRYSLDSIDPLQRLTLGSTNGAGCLAIGDLSEERISRTWTEVDLERAFHDWIHPGLDMPQSSFVDFLAIVAPTSSQGGAKPKLNLEHDNSLWIVKFPDKGDPQDFAGIEAAALSLAQECGIETPRHRVLRVGEGESSRLGLMIERFDRRRLDGGYERLAFASAFTVMDLNTGIEEGLKSYVNFAHESVRWCARGGSREHADLQKREIWRRIVLNTLVNNTDDHPRNHALIRDGGLWRLSPVFDVVPAALTIGQHDRALHMPFHRGVERPNAVTRQRLVEASKFYGWKQDEAGQELQRMAGIVSKRWEHMMNKHGVSQPSVKARSSAFGFATELAPA